MIEAAFDPQKFTNIRSCLASIPPAENHRPNDSIKPETMVLVPQHRNALDPDRCLVVGNRGMGKSYWTLALANSETLEKTATFYSALRNVKAVIGFNGSDVPGPVAPTPTEIDVALRCRIEPDIIWRAVLVRTAIGVLSDSSEFSRQDSFSALAGYVATHREDSDQLLKRLDNNFINQKRKLLVVFDALDRFNQPWETTKSLTQALLKRALAAQSYRAIRFKLFMRQDQFENSSLFQFPDGSKIRNTRVDLSWSPHDLYNLLFLRLEQLDDTHSFSELKSAIEQRSSIDSEDGRRLLVNALAGEFMGKTEKRGLVYTWLPLHLSDAREETSPRTFLTAWSEAARHGEPLKDKVVDHFGLQAGVAKASEDRLAELKEDYQWISEALEPLRGQMVPIEKTDFIALWEKEGTVKKVQKAAPETTPFLVAEKNENQEEALLETLKAIGVIEIRANGKINVPDIFRVHAGIKRKGGVKPPRKTS